MTIAAYWLSGLDSASSTSFMLAWVLPGRSALVNFLASDYSFCFWLCAPLFWGLSKILSPVIPWNAFRQSSCWPQACFTALHPLQNLSRGHTLSVQVKHDK